VNKKFEPQYTVKNCVNYLFTSNHADAFFMSCEDRRYFVHEITAEKLPPAFFAKYDKWYHKQEAINAVFYYLLHLDLEGFNPQGEAPHTQSRKDMIAAGKSEHQAWIAELKEFPDNKLRVNDTVLPYCLYTTEDLLALYQPDDAAQRRRYPVTAKAMRLAMKEEQMRQMCGGAAVDTGKGKRQRLWLCRPEDKFYTMTMKQASAYYLEERRMKHTPKKFSREAAK
jgi:hypothetical protein